MQSPGLPSLLFLAYVFVLLPRAAIRSARVVHGDAARLPMSRERVWMGTLVGLSLLFGLAYVTARSFDYDPFAIPRFGARDLLAGAVAFGICIGVRQIARMGLTDAVRRTMAVYRIAPRTSREWALWALACVAAGIGEEVAYRGVAVQILWFTFGSPWPAIALSAGTFAIVHWMQGRRSMLAVLAIALVMHALVAYTGTLVIAMAVHLTYDLLAGWQIGRRAAQLDATPA